ncbi:haloalkane dehalogenase [Chloroflexi bacterium TSY]|nr:haloalkane dehalogenase [Chloroflexi bacterium TSY]
MPYETQYATVNGSQMAYVEAGQGDPILFLHGNPTSKYLWRNVVPHLEDQGRVIAVDLIGMGESDKPDIDYTFDTHSQYLDGFIEALALENITLVIHDWGSGLGFDYATRNEDNVKAIAFMEAAIAPAFPPQSENLAPSARLFQGIMSLPGVGNTLLLDRNMMVEQFLPGDVRRGLTETELNAYRAPFPDEESRKVILTWVRSIPRDGEPADVTARVDAYNAWFLESELPKLHLYATPGALNPPEIVEALQAMELANYKAVFVGEGGHFIQEDRPHEIGQSIAEWYSNINP